MKNHAGRREQDDPLMRVVPLTAKREEGMVYFMAQSRVEQWSRDHAAELLELGYVRLEITQHTPSTVVGDMRRKRR